MASKKLKTHCRIFNWIRDENSELAQIMIDLCLEHITDTSKRQNSITFLMPDSKLMNEIREKSEADNTKDARTIIKSLVIPLALPNKTAFKNKKIIGNKSLFTFPEAKIESNDEVTFGDKLSIKLNPVKFQNEYDHTMVVWNIIKGIPPSDYKNEVGGSKGYIIEYIEPKKTGGAINNTIESQFKNNYRSVFAETVENMFRKNIRNVHIKNPYVSIVVALLKELIKDQHIVKVKPILDINPIITFYLLIEPYKLVGEHLVSNDIFTDDFLNSTIGSDFNCNNYIEIINKQIDSPNVVFNDTKDFIIIINEIRTKLLNEQDPTLLPSKVLDIYNTLESDNMIKDVITKKSIINVLPEKLFNHYKNNHNKRLWQDEYRFMVGECLKNIKDEPNLLSKVNMFNNLISTLRYDIRGDNYSEELCIINFENYKQLNACVRDRVRMMQYFVNSSDFLFVGCQLDLVCDISSPNYAISSRSSSDLKALETNAFNQTNNTESIMPKNPDSTNNQIIKLSKQLEEQKILIDQLRKTAST